MWTTVSHCCERFSILSTLHRPWGTLQLHDSILVAHRRHKLSANLGSSEPPLSTSGRTNEIFPSISAPPDHRETHQRHSTIHNGTPPSTFEACGCEFASPALLTCLKTFHTLPTLPTPTHTPTDRPSFHTYPAYHASSSRGCKHDIEVSVPPLANPSRITKSGV